MYEVVFILHLNVLFKLYACCLLIILLRKCEVMGLHMYIELVGLEQECLCDVKSTYAIDLLMPPMRIWASVDLYVVLS